MNKILLKHFVINLLFFVNILCDIPENTLISINTGTKSVEQFSIAEKLTSYSLEDRQFKNVTIKSIAKYKSKDFVVIQTYSGMLCCGTEAKIFSVSKNNFIKSTDLDSTDILLSSELKQYPVEKIVSCESEKESTFFILSLEEPHTFFQCDSSGTPFLMHNNPAVFVLEYVIEKSPEIFGFVIDKAPEIIEIASSSVLALFGAKVAHDNIKHSHTLNEQRKTEIRQRYIEFLEDKVRFGKSTIEDQERLQLFTDFPGISDEEVDKRVEANRKHRESYIKNNKAVIKILAEDKYEQLIKYLKLTNQIKSSTPNNNVNLNNDVSTEQEKQPPIIGDDNDKSNDKESDKNEDVSNTVKDPSVNDPIIDPVLKGSTKEPKTKGRTKIFSKPGSEKERQEDFDQLNSYEVKKSKEGFKIGKTKNGKTLISREKSKDKRPTLEIQEKTSSGRIKYIKIRYTG